MFVSQKRAPNLIKEDDITLFVWMNIWTVEIVISLTFEDIPPYYSDMIISVRSALLMPKSNHVTQFMEHHMMELAAISNRYCPACAAGLAHCTVTTEWEKKEIRGRIQWQLSFTLSFLAPCAMTVDCLRRPSEINAETSYIHVFGQNLQKKQWGNCLLRSSEKRDIIVLFFLVHPWHKLDASLWFPIIHRCSNNPLKFRHILYNSNNRMKTRTEQLKCRRTVQTISPVHCPKPISPVGCSTPNKPATVIGQRVTQPWGPPSDATVNLETLSFPSCVRFVGWVRNFILVLPFPTKISTC